MERRYIVKLEGGLGNQLFQYAHAVAMQKKYGGRIIIDTHAFTKRQSRTCALRKYILNDDTFFADSAWYHFIIFLNLIILRVVNRGNLIKSRKDYCKFASLGLFVQFQTRWFDSFVRPKMKYNYFVGNWMSIKFFHCAVQEVAKAITPREAISGKNKGLLNEIISSESVCIHIRLGDYLSPQWKDKLYVCVPEYYRRAISLIKQSVKNPKFFVFSNKHKDFEMIKSEYELGDVTYVDMGNTDVEDLELMRSCKHFIMSNSTYSWWSQFLCANQGKIVVAPSRFNNYPEWDMTDIYQDNWRILDV